MTERDLSGKYFLVHNSGYDEPELVGPFESRNAALLEWYRDQIEDGGYEPEDSDPQKDAEQLYFDSDGVNIGRLTQLISEEATA